jgi:hypothetical protein
MLQEHFQSLQPYLLICPMLSESDYKRDRRTGALVAVNTFRLNTLRNEVQKTQSLRTEIDILKRELEELKNIVRSKT